MYNQALYKEWKLIKVVGIRMSRLRKKTEDPDLHRTCMERRVQMAGATAKAPVLCR